MPIQISIDEELVEEARAAGGFKTAEAAVNAALREFIGRWKPRNNPERQREIIKLFGKFDPDESYDYKKARNYKRARNRRPTAP